MSLMAFEQLPETARLWIYGADRPLSDPEKREIATQLERFLAEWTAHKQDLCAAWQILHDFFILIGVDESQLAASGCSIDALSRFLRGLEERFELRLVDTHARVFYRDAGGAVRCVERAAFKILTQTQAVTADTRVFDNTIQSVGLLRAGRWEVPMRESWHWHAFATKTPPA